LKTAAENWLEQQARMRGILLAQPYSSAVSREVERIDAEVELFWASLEPERRDAE
jgi:hypothetical protein